MTSAPTPRNTPRRRRMWWPRSIIPWVLISKRSYQARRDAPFRSSIAGSLNVSAVAVVGISVAVVEGCSEIDFEVADIVFSDMVSVVTIEELVVPAAAVVVVVACLVVDS